MFTFYTIHDIYDNNQYHTLDKDKVKDVRPTQSFKHQKTRPISWRKWHNGVVFKVDDLRHGCTLFFLFYFQDSFVEQMNLDDSLLNKTKKVMLGW